MGKLVRLDRFLAQAGTGSRAEVKKMIRAGRILVNRETVKSGDLKIDLESDIVCLDGKQILSMETPTVMMNKPSGVVSATQDHHDRTVIDLISEPWAEKLFPMGRLDKDTEGLMILTGDGQMSHELLSPKKHVVKTYYAVISGAPDSAVIDRFREGIDIGEKHKTLPAGLIFLSRGDFECGEGECHFREKSLRKEDLEQRGEGEYPFWEKSLRKEDLEQCGEGEYPFWEMSIRQEDLNRCGENECCVVISITEGKFHQIKRMFAACEREVHYLKRIAMGRLSLDPSLEPGQYRVLTPEEIELLRSR